MSLALQLEEAVGVDDVPVRFGTVTLDNFPRAMWTITGAARDLYYKHVHKPGEMPRWARGKAERMLVQMWRLYQRTAPDDDQFTEATPAIQPGDPNDPIANYFENGLKVRLGCPNPDYTKR